MTSNGFRGPAAGTTCSGRHAALIVIDYQPSQIAAVESMDEDALLKNIVSTVKLA